MRPLRTFIFVAILTTLSRGAEIDFDTEVVPRLSKAGCNAAACHGGAAGQAGFRLSLFGGDPSFDYRTIVQELEGRRVDLVRPRESLLIAKPTEQLEHGGGLVLDHDSDAADVLETWIREGASRLKRRRLTDLRVTPRHIRGDTLPIRVQLQVRAEFDDGLQRDVSSLAVYTSQSDSALTLSETGLLEVTKPGRQSAIVRFGDQIRTVLVTSPLGTTETKTEAANANWIDDEVDSVLNTLKLAAAPPTNDAAFLRRLQLDLTGRLPTTTRVHSFLQDSSLDKRARLVDDLIASDEFTEYWSHLLANVLRLRVPATDGAAAERFYEWLHAHVKQDTGWDVMVSELLSSEGDTHVRGEATFHRFFATAREQAEYVSEVFLGVRLRCANCHNHPLDKWTQDDYHGLAQIFAGVQRGRVITVNDRGEVSHPRTGKAAVARLPGVRFLSGTDHRQALIAWMTNAENDYFARAIVGRVWEMLMGRGLISPTDDIRETNAATHPRLLERLSDYFVEHDYRLRPLIRVICTSAAYGRSSETPAGQIKDDRFYSHAIAKPLSAEVLADAISDVTGIGSHYGGSSARRAISVIDRRQATEELQYLGQCLPDETCNAATSGGGRGLASKLHLMNGELINRKIAHEHGSLQEMLGRDLPTAEIINQLVFSALTRPATSREQKTWTQRIESGSAKERAERCQDFLWALLNCREFTTNH